MYGILLVSSHIFYPFCCFYLFVHVVSTWNWSSIQCESSNVFRSRQERQSPPTLGGSPTSCCSYRAPTVVKVIPTGKKQNTSQSLHPFNQPPLPHGSTSFGHWTDTGSFRVIWAGSTRRKCRLECQCFKSLTLICLGTVSAGTISLLSPPPL